MARPAAVSSGANLARVGSDHETGRIGELIPPLQRRRFVTRQEFAAMSRNAPAVDLEAFRADQDATDQDTRRANEQ